MEEIAATEAPTQALLLSLGLSDKEVAPPSPRRPAAPPPHRRQAAKMAKAAASPKVARVLATLHELLGLVGDIPGPAVGKAVYQAAQAIGPCALAPGGCPHRPPAQHV